MITTLDLLEIENGIGRDMVEQGIKKYSPELEVFPAEIIDGQEIKCTITTGLPTVAYRAANSGTPRSKAKRKSAVFQTSIFDSQVAVDQELADARKPEARARMMSNEMSLRIRAAVHLFSDKTWYGDPEQGEEFPGVYKQLPDDTSHVMNVGASSAKTSVIFIEADPAFNGYIWGNSRTFKMNAGAWPVETVLDEKNNPFQAYVNWLKGNNGFHLSAVDSVFRLKGIGTAEGKTLNDDWLYKAYEKVDDLGMKPTHIFMNSRSLNQLRASRTATNETGKPAPIPTHWEDIPIMKSSHIINSEA